MCASLHLAPLLLCADVPLYDNAHICTYSHAHCPSDRHMHMQLHERAGADRTSIPAGKAAAAVLSPAVKKPCNWLQGTVRAPSAKPAAVEAFAALACKGFV